MFKIFVPNDIKITVYSVFQAVSVYQISSDQISRSVVSDSLRPHESQHARPPCPSPTLRVHWDSRPSSQWCHPSISSSVVPFSSCPQSLPASESFPMSQLFAWGGQSTGVSFLSMCKLAWSQRLKRRCLKLFSSLLPPLWYSIPVIIAIYPFWTLMFVFSCWWPWCALLWISLPAAVSVTCLLAESQGVCRLI